MKKIIINCRFGGNVSPFSFYVGNPAENQHPIHYQAEWLSKSRYGTVPGEIMKGLQDLYHLAKKNNLSFEELCEHALGENQPDAEGAE